MKRAVVTGGCGFIGSHLVDALLEAGVKVTVIDKKKPRKAVKREGVTYKKYDVQSEEAAEVIRKKKPDVVFHLAVHGHDRNSIKEPVMNAENNVIGTLNILQAVRANKKGRVVFASSGGVIYGYQEQMPITEAVVPKPITPLAISKLTAEHYLHFYNHVLHIPTIALRLANVYGPRQDSSSESGAIGVFAANLLKGEPTFINNDGQTTRDYLYIDDAIYALMAAATSDEVGVFNIGTGIETSTIDLFEAVREEVGVEAKPENREEVEDVVKRSALDSTKAAKLLGWEPTIGLEDGIKNTVSWYSAHE